MALRASRAPHWAVLELAAGSSSRLGWASSRRHAPPTRPPGSCRSLFQSTALRQRRPHAGAGPGRNAKAGPPDSPTPPSRKKTSPSPPLSRPAPLPFRPSSASSSSREQQKQQQDQQKREQPLDSLFSQRKLPLVGAALAAGVLGFYIMPLLVTYLAGGCREEEHHDHNYTHAHEASPDAVPTGLPPMGAAAFDASLDVPERMMGIAKLRKRLAAAARGAVLEVAVGTGRNAGYYAWEPALFEPDNKRLHAPPDAPGRAPAVASFTGLDLSGDALGVARGRLRIAVPGAQAAIPKGAAAIEEGGDTLPAEVVDVLDGKLRLFRGDAMQPLPPPAPSAAPAPYYDTIVQTFGLCSVADPAALLANMAAVLRPGTGRIVLLEHGRGRWPVVNALLDRYAGRHFARFGCWWNRDMGAILARAQAAAPGLEVVAVAQPGWFQFGTLWWIELRVKEKEGGAK